MQEKRQIGLPTWNSARGSLPMHLPIDHRKVSKQIFLVSLVSNLEDICFQKRHNHVRAALRISRHNPEPCVWINPSRIFCYCASVNVEDRMPPCYMNVLRRRHSSLESMAVLLSYSRLPDVVTLRQRPGRIERALEIEL